MLYCCPQFYFRCIRGTQDKCVPNLPCPEKAVCYKILTEQVRIHSSQRFSKKWKHAHIKCIYIYNIYTSSILINS